MDEMDERRSSPRRRTLLAGRILFNNRSSVRDCTVRDLSDTGAQIYFADASAPPPEFELEIPNRGLRMRSRVAWSQGANHGAQFVEVAKEKAYPTSSWVEHTNLPGRILFNNRSSVLNCTVRDLSGTGARIYFADVSALPPEFELEIPSRGLRVRSRVAWSQGANHGAQFLEEIKVSADPRRTMAA